MKNLFPLVLLFAAIAPAQQYTKDGELLAPKEYRKWDFLTASVGMSYPENGPATGKPVFGNLFVNPEAHTQFLKTGTWPDRTVLVIEDRESDNRPGLDKNAKFQTNLLGLEVHVKDASHAGWMFYFIPKDAASGKPFDRTAKCYSCHEKNAAVDTTFVQYYPTLIDAAKKHGTYKKTAE